MTQQLDLVGLPLDDATTRRIALPQPREVLHRRLREVLITVPPNIDQPEPRNDA